MRETSAGDQRRRPAQETKVAALRTDSPRSLHELPGFAKLREAPGHELPRLEVWSENEMPNLLNETSGMMAFVRSVETGSFSAAARALNTTPSAVSKSVARLEGKLGTRLFLRSTRALRLTRDGQAFFDRVAPLLKQLDSSDDAFSEQSSPSGRFRVSMPRDMAPLLLPGLFRAQLDCRTRCS